MNLKTDDSENTQKTDFHYLRSEVIKKIYVIIENEVAGLNIMWLTTQNFDLYLSCTKTKEIKNNNLKDLLLNALICLLLSYKLEGKTCSLNLINHYGNFNLTLEELNDREIQLLNTINWQLKFWSPFYELYQQIDLDSFLDIDYRLKIISQKILLWLDNLKISNYDIILIYKYCLQPSKKKLESIPSYLQEMTLNLLDNNKKDLTNFFKSTKIKTSGNKLNKFIRKKEINMSLICFETI